MNKPFHLETFSKGMKAKMDVTYRRTEGENFGVDKSRDNL